MNVNLPQNLTSASQHSPTDLEQRKQTWYLIVRAYQNIYGMQIPTDPTYQQAIFDAALQLRRDPRTRDLREKALMHAFEDIIRISDEHHQKAQKHLSRASSPVYLRETAIDNLLEQKKYLDHLAELAPSSEVRTRCIEDSGRLYRRHVKTSSSEIMELAYQQLALSTEPKLSEEK